MKAGFVNIFGRPNAGKSTLLNALMGEKLAIVSHKIQTTRHRIKGILSKENYQIIFSDTPGIIQPEYKLHEKMMLAVKDSLEDADLALLMHAVHEDMEESDRIFSSLHLKVPAFVVISKIDAAKKEKTEQATGFFKTRSYCKEVIGISALKSINLQLLLEKIVQYLPEGAPFFEGDELTDRPVRFFAGEIIREKIFELYEEEIPYHSTVLIQDFKEKPNITSIRADIIVQREGQKGIILGEGGRMIKKLGTEARKDIEAFVGQKVFLELFVKVKPKWRDNELFLREYGY